MSQQITLTIDGQEITAQPGDKVLWAALANKIYIPHLCAIEENHTPFASCRLCFVEIKGYPSPVTACTETVQPGMAVTTRSPRVDRLVRTGFEMLMTNHRLECNICPANHSCALQRIARERGLSLKPKELPLLERNLPVDDSAPGIIYDPNKCVLCGRCVWVCKTRGAGILGFARRGFDRMVTTFRDAPLAESNCNYCDVCAGVCPVGALTIKCMS
ncbi:MAG: ferredoxin [Peptococcaceae bacterium BRH_c4b]|nr:MAG: ferredoxin [Peptococcaceae bacterium BRH_c4b]